MAVTCCKFLIRFMKKITPVYNPSVYFRLYTTYNVFPFPRSLILNLSRRPKVRTKICSNEIILNHSKTAQILWRGHATGPVAESVISRDNKPKQDQNSRSRSTQDKGKSPKVVDMSQNGTENRFKYYKVVLTGGPCGGKTTGQTRLSTFFENLGWRVYRAPESALQYLSGGVRFQDLTPEEAFVFQEDIIKTMMMVEETYNHLARTRTQNVLLICDRGVMDGSAYIPRADWQRMKERNNWNDVDLRDNRYNQIIHMVSAAKGAEDFYTGVGHLCRLEHLEEAIELDTITADAWVGHPYYDVIDNSTDFESKIARMIAAVCTRVGIDLGDRLAPNSIKRKFLISHMADSECFPHYQEFHVVHDYLVTPSRRMQARLRKRGQEGNWTYTHTIRRPEINDQSVELRMSISEKDYEILLAQRDYQHHTVFKIRRCFLWNNQYFQLDMYQDPTPPRCQDLILLETFTTVKDLPHLPDFLTVEREVTNDPRYSMFNLSHRDEGEPYIDDVDGQDSTKNSLKDVTPCASVDKNESK